MSSSSLPTSKPMISVAGIRGVVGESLRVEEFLRYAMGFMAEIVPARLVLGGDTRSSGVMLRHLIYAAAEASGVEVLDLGVVPTPTVGLMVRRLKAGGGIALTASHNPPPWNALKFFSSEGSFLRPEQLARVLENCETSNFARAAWDELGHAEVVVDPLGPHLDTLLKQLPVETIRKRRFKVALDACNGAGLEISQRLFKALGVRSEIIHATQNGRFDRAPEPLPENLGKLRRTVKSFGADIGFALDPDADRLAIVDEAGRAIGEERTITLAAEYMLRRVKGPVVVNLSTTRAVEDVAAAHGASVTRTKIGEAHVVTAMKSLNAAIGGEGNGGIIMPKVHPGRDSATGMGLILALLADEPSGRGRRTLSQINESIPDYVIVKDKIDLPELAEAARVTTRMKEQLDTIAKAAPGTPSINETDGLKIILPDRWLHVRASGTEPILRLFAEAPRRRDAEALVAWARGIAG